MAKTRGESGGYGGSSNKKTAYGSKARAVAKGKAAGAQSIKKATKKAPFQSPYRAPTAGGPTLPGMPGIRSGGVKAATKPSRSQVNKR